MEKVFKFLSRPPRSKIKPEIFYPQEVWSGEDLHPYFNLKISVSRWQAKAASPVDQ